MGEVKIRHYEDSDFDEICSWWRGHQEFAPLPGMMTEEGTFVLELDGKPVMTLSVMMTQSKQVSYFEGYCAKPGLDQIISNQLGVILWEHGYNYLKKNGYKRVIAFTDKKKLVDRYTALGMTPSMLCLTALGRNL